MKPNQNGAMDPNGRIDNPAAAGAGLLVPTGGIDPYETHPSSTQQLGADFFNVPPGDSGQQQPAQATQGGVQPGQPAGGPTPPDPLGIESTGVDPAAAPGDGGELSTPQGYPWGDGQPLPDHMTPEAAYAASRYFQGELDRLRQQTTADMAQYQQMAPIVTALMEDTEALNYLTQRWQQQSTQSFAGHANGTESVNQPLRLEPVNLPGDMPEDLYSEEGERWLRGMNQTLQALAQQNQALSQHLTQQQQQQQALIQQQQQQQTNQQALAEIQHTLGVNAKDAADFLQLVQERGIGIHDTWQQAGAAWVASRRQSADQVRQQNALSMAQNRVANRFPQTAAGSPGVGMPPAPVSPQNSLFLPASPTGAIDPFAT